MSNKVITTTQHRLPLSDRKPRRNISANYLILLFKRCLATVFETRFRLKFNYQLFISITVNISQLQFWGNSILFKCCLATVVFIATGRASAAAAARRAYASSSRMLKINRKKKTILKKTPVIVSRTRRVIIRYTAPRGGGDKTISKTNSSNLEKDVPSPRRKRSLCTHSRVAM